MIYIFEGIDKSGKTTLAELLSKYLDIPIFRSSDQKSKKLDLEKAIQYDWNFYLDIASQTNQDIIFDRSYISQYVYSLVYRKHNVYKLYSIDQYNNIFLEYNRKLQKIDHKLFYCLRKDYNNIYDDFVDLSKVNKLKEVYETFFNLKESVNKIDLYFENSIETNFKILKKELNI